jgi:hypothetical protein
MLEPGHSLVIPHRVGAQLEVFRHQPVILPESKDFSKPRSCDIINSGRLSKPVISDSISQMWHMFWYIESIHNMRKPVISSEISPKFDRVPTTDILPDPQLSDFMNL